MLMSVTERYREIGTIKCLGASDQFVVRVFLLESLLLGTVGSGVGALSGGLLAALIESQMDGRVWMMVGETCLLGMAITSLAAIIPAIQAAKMPAAAALRMEG